MAVVHRVLGAVVAVLAASGLVTLAARAGGHHARAPQPITLDPLRPHRPLPTTTTTTSTTSTTTTTTTAAPRPTAPVTLAGCPVPPRPPGPPPPPPWHPAVLVPDSQLPPVQAPAAWASDLKPIAGKGMWIWEWSHTDGGDAAAVVARAVAAGLRQVWVRVGDSADGFYGAAELTALVPKAHAAGLNVVAWGFPYLYDPLGDARWTAQILAWRGPGGAAVDGYSADIERLSEGVDLTARRAAVYLQQVRRDAGSRLVVATVYPPIDAYWTGGGYPFSAMAPYVDAFAPMIYWECTDPGADAALDIARLATLRPVHIIGQAYDMGSGGGRVGAPSAGEITEFLQTGRRRGAVGASFWVWQTATAEEWQAVSSFRW
jgi:hypothetical protein